MTEKILGKCGNCGGRVSIPTVWMGIYPPTPKCQNCHAVADDNMPTIAMKEGTGLPRGQRVSDKVEKIAKQWKKDLEAERKLGEKLSKIKY